jgi:hypothetical protein
MVLSRRKKRPVVPARSRGTMSGGGAGASQRPSRQLKDKRKANELASSGDLSETANRRWVRASTRDFISQGELAAVGSQQLVCAASGEESG